jgi:hypothetical protein
MIKSKLLSGFREYNDRLMENIGLDPECRTIEMCYELERTLIEAADSKESIEKTIEKIQPIIKKLYGLNGDKTISVDLDKIKEAETEYASLQILHYKRLLNTNAKGYIDVMNKAYSNNPEEYIQKRYQLLLSIMDRISEEIQIQGSTMERLKAAAKVKAMKVLCSRYINKMMEEELC